MNVDLSEYDHPTWLTVGGTAAGYLLLLGAMTVVLFGLPTLLFFLLG